MNRLEFIEVIKSLENPEDWGFFYYKNCTDPFSKSSKNESKTANYVFQLRNMRKKLMPINLQEGFHRSTHETKQKELVKKYTSWVRSFLNSDSPCKSNVI